MRFQPVTWTDIVLIAFVLALLVWGFSPVWVAWLHRKGNFIDRWFAREEMDVDGRCATYLARWTLLKLPGRRGVYLHHFVGDDWSRDLHDHPKRFVSIGLWGRYIEETPGSEAGSVYPQPHVERLFVAPWIRTFPATHIHRIRLVDGRPCWTLVIVLKTVRPWGFWHAHRWVPWRTYVGSDAATKMKSCPD